MEAKIFYLSFIKLEDKELLINWNIIILFT